MSPFTAYGLTIDSEFPLPELETCRGDPDVYVRRGETPEPPDRPVEDARLYRVPGGHYIRFEHIGSLCAKNGRSLIVDPVDDVAAEVLRQLVLGRGLRVLLHQRGYVVLHASSAVVDGRAVAFVGVSGQGKSTTVAGFYGEGHTVLADDVTPVDPETAEVLPGFQQVKLDRNAAEGVTASLTPANAGELSRQYYVAPSPVNDESVPLRRVYLLADGPEIEIETVPPSGRPFHLMRSSTSVYRSVDDEQVESHFRDCVRLGSDIPVKRLQRPLRFDALPEVVRAVEDDLGRTSIESATER